MTTANPNLMTFDDGQTELPLGLPPRAFLVANEDAPHVADPDMIRPEHPSLGYRASETFSRVAGMCGFGAENNLSVRIAEWFFIDCPCCLFWRGAAVGAVSAFLLTAAALFGFIATILIGLGV